MAHKQKLIVALLVILFGCSSPSADELKFNNQYEITLNQFEIGGNRVQSKRQALQVLFAALSLQGATTYSHLLGSTVPRWSEGLAHAKDAIPYELYARTKLTQNIDSALYRFGYRRTDRVDRGNRIATVHLAEIMQTASTDLGEPLPLDISSEIEERLKSENLRVKAH